MIIDNEFFAKAESKVIEIVNSYHQLPNIQINLVDFWKSGEETANALERLIPVACDILMSENDGYKVSIKDTVKRLCDGNKEVSNIFDKLTEAVEKRATIKVIGANEIIMEPVPHAPVPTYIISAGKVEVKFPESNANVEQKVKDFFGSECMLKSLAAKLADGEYQFKVLSGDAKVPLKLLCCLPDKEILLSYKDDNCDVAVVEI